MSRAYRVSVSETLRRHVRVEDGVQSSLELLPLLPAGRLAELLGAELEQRGFVREGQQARRVDEDGTEVTVELETGTVTVRVASETELELQRRGSGVTGDRDRMAPAEAALRQRVRQDLEREAGVERERLQRQLTERLEQKLRDLQQELDGAVNRTTAAALKEKAAQLGEIEEISEDAETGSVTIRVRL